MNLKVVIEESYSKSCIATRTGVLNILPKQNTVGYVILFPNDILTDNEYLLRELVWFDSIRTDQG